MEIISYLKLVDILKTLKYPTENKKNITSVCNGINQDFTDTEEVAQFLSQLFHESFGLQKIVEENPPADGYIPKDFNTDFEEPEGDKEVDYYFLLEDQDEKNKWEEIKKEQSLKEAKELEKLKNFQELTQEEYNQLSPSKQKLYDSRLNLKNAVINCIEKQRSILKPSFKAIKNVNDEKISYIGRGFIQLTHTYNYERCSKDLFGNDLLLRKPWLVSTNPYLAYKVSFWYWNVFVRKEEYSADNFCNSTRAINPMELDPKNNLLHLA